MHLGPRRFHPRTGPCEHRVVRPRHPLRHTSPRAPEPIGLLLGDHDGLNRLAGLFSFAAYSRHPIVHVPLRDGVPPGEGRGELVDLVLVHHSYGLRPGTWPEPRRSLGPGTPLPARTGEARTDRDAAAWRRRAGRPDCRDELRHATHARAFFLFGSRDVFAEAAMSLAYAAGWGPRRKGVVKGATGDDAGCPRPHTESRRRTPLRGLVCFKPCPPHAHFKRPGR